MNRPPLTNTSGIEQTEGYPARNLQGVPFDHLKHPHEEPDRLAQHQVTEGAQHSHQGREQDQPDILRLIAAHGKRPPTGNLPQHLHNATSGLSVFTRAPLIMLPHGIFLHRCKYSYSAGILLFDHNSRPAV